MKLKYLWKGSWYYIDFSKNTVPQFKLWESRSKTSPLSLGRKAIGIELKDSYYKQAVLNIKDASKRFVNKKGQKKLQF